MGMKMNRVLIIDDEILTIKYLKSLHSWEKFGCGDILYAVTIAAALDIFQREGQVWRRGGELHEEYAYTMDELEEYLKQAGFVRIRRYGELKRRTPKEGEQRIFFTAVKGE